MVYLNTLNTTPDVWRDADVKFPIQENSIVTYIPYLIALTLISCVGVCGNVFVIGAIATNKKLQIMSNSFIANLAITDLLVTGVAVPFAFVGVVDRAFLLRHRTLCSAIGSISITSCGCSIWTIAAIAVDRYVHICHPNLPELFTHRTAPFILACPWILGFALDVPNFTGWGAHGYDPVGLNCLHYIKYYGYTIYICALGAIIPMFIIPNCYIRIYRRVQMSNRRLKMQKHTRGVINGAKNHDLRTLKIAFTIWVVFTIMWTPYLINSLTSQFLGKWPGWLLMTVHVLALSNSALNCIIYGIMHERFRKGYVMFFRRISFKVVVGKSGTDLSSL